MIPQFPQFKKVEVADRADVEAHTHRFEPYSDFNFTSLYAWDTNGERMISELNGNLVVKFTDYSTHEPFLSFLGSNETEHTARTLIDYCKENHLTTTLKLVPEISIQGIRPSVLKVEKDRDNFDYLLPIHDLALMEGSKLKGRRNFVNRFIKENPGAHAEIADLADPSAEQRIFSVFDMWRENKILKEKEHESEHEEAAIRRLVQTSGSHALTLTAVFLGDTISGFSIDEPLPNQYCMGHFWKADTGYTGIYDFLIQKRAQHFESTALTTWNYQQDLGVEGLRRSKLDYRPVDFLKKYLVQFPHA